MIIKSIILKNFQCFSGENRFDFQKGINVVIADNAAGKSKLFDGFYWVLYDRVFETSSREFKSTSLVKKDLVSDRAKYECSENEQVETSVELISTDNSADYHVTRKFIIQKIKKGDINDDRNWKQDKQSELIVYKRGATASQRLTDEDEKNYVLNKIISDLYKPYLWFQGEQVDSLIDFKNTDSLTNAINVLSDIKRYDKYKAIANRLFNIAEKDYISEQKKYTKDEESLERLSIKKNKIEFDINQRKIELDNYKAQYSKAEQRLEELMGKIEDASRINDLNQETARISERIKIIKGDLDTMQKSFSKKLFVNHWILRNAQALIEIYDKAYSNYQEKTLEKQAELRSNEITTKRIKDTLQTRLPINVPEPIYIEQMLNKEWCLVCDRQAEKGSVAYDKIKELLDASKENIKEGKHLTKRNLSKVFKMFYDLGLSFRKIINNIDEDIKSEIESIDELNKQRIVYNEKLKEIEQQIINLLGTTSFKKEEVGNVINEFSIQSKRKESLIAKIEEAKGTIETKNKEKQIVNEDIEKLVVGEINNKLIEDYELMKDLNEITISTRERIYENLIKQLEIEANKHFLSMTEKNKSFRGKIILEKLSYGTYMPRNVDDQGNKLSSINDSNLIMIKLATIMAIISAKGKSSENYPLISDAPTSKFSDDYTLGFCNTVSKVYGQAIIMSYDFYNNENLRKRLFNEVSNLGNVYILEPSIKNANRNNRRELSIHISKIN